MAITFYTRETLPGSKSKNKGDYISLNMKTGTFFLSNGAAILMQYAPEDKVQIGIDYSDKTAFIKKSDIGFSFTCYRNKKGDNIYKMSSKYLAIELEKIFSNEVVDGKLYFRLTETAEPGLFELMPKLAILSKIK